MFIGTGSVLLLPDPHRPVLHLVSEAPEAAEADELLAAYEAKVTSWLE